MHKMQNRTGKAMTMHIGLAYGTGAALLTSMLGIGIAAKLVDKEVVHWDNIGYMILVVLMLSSWVGAIISIHKIKRQRLVVGLASGLLYLLSLIIMTALFFGGKYNGVGESALLILCGSMVAALTGHREKGRTRRIESYNR